MNPLVQDFVDLRGGVVAEEISKPGLLLAVNVREYALGVLLLAGA